MKHSSHDQSLVIKTITELAKPIQYLQYDDKLKIIEATLDQVKNQKFYTASLYRQFIINLINAYTDIEMDKNGFDIFSENGLLDIIISLFEEEYKTCNHMLQMCIADLKGR